MKLAELEKNVVRKIEKDINDPEVFNALRDLIYYWLLRAKKLRKTADAHNVATEMAGDLYMKALGGQVIDYWLPYIRASYGHYLKNYKEYNYKQYFNLTGDPEAVVSMAELFNGSLSLSNFSAATFSEVSDIDFICSLPKFIDSLIEDSCRYTKSSHVLNLKISLLLGLVRSSDPVFRIPTGDSNYIKFLKNEFRSRLISTLKESSAANDSLLDIDTISGMFKISSEVGFDMYE